MYSSFEVFAIITIIIVQIMIARHAYRQIMQTTSFLPNGRASLELKEYEIPSDKILELEPSDVVGKIAYIVRDDVMVTPVESSEQPRDERGRFTSKQVADVSVDEEDYEDYSLLT